MESSQMKWTTPSTSSLVINYLILDISWNLLKIIASHLLRMKNLFFSVCAKKELNLLKCNLKSISNISLCSFFKIMSDLSIYS